MGSITIVILVRSVLDFVGYAICCVILSRYTGREYEFFVFSQ